MPWNVYCEREGIVDAEGREIPVASADTLQEAIHYARMYGGATRVMQEPDCHARRALEGE